MASIPRSIPFKVGGNIFIALVVWLAGVAFTAQAVPLPVNQLGPVAPWIAAAIVQIALSLAQTNIRDGGATAARWPYIALVFVDIGFNTVGLLVLYGIAPDPQAALVYILRAVTTADGLWQLVACILCGALVAALPEQLVRDAIKSQSAHD